MHIEKDFKNKLTKEDYVKYLLNRNMILLLSPLVILALLVATIFSIVKDGFTFSTIIYLLPVLLFILSYVQMYRVITHTLKAQKEIKELKITFTDNEYKDSTDGEVNSLPYDKAYCYKETKKYLYVFVDKNNALIIPKREFEDEEITKITNAFSKKMKKKSLYDLYSWTMVGIFILLIVLIVYNLVI